MKTLLTFCCLVLSTAAMAKSVELTIDNQSIVDFKVQYKGRDTTIDPKIDIINKGKTVTTTMTEIYGNYPTGTFLLNPNQQRVGISVAPPSIGQDGRLIVTGCPFCEPTGTSYIKDYKAKVAIKLER